MRILRYILGAMITFLSLEHILKWISVYWTYSINAEVLPDKFLEVYTYATIFGFLLHLFIINFLSMIIIWLKRKKSIRFCVVEIVVSIFVTFFILFFFKEILEFDSIDMEKVISFSDNLEDSEFRK